MRFAFALIVAAFPVLTQASDQSVIAFKPIVGRIERQLARQPLLFDVSKYSQSPSGIIVVVHRYSAGPLRYDVKKTDSLVTPIVGSVQFDVGHQSTNKCGSVDTESGYYGRYAASVDEAKQLASKDDCWIESLPTACSVTVLYGYDDKHWEFKQLISDPLGCSVLFNYASGVNTSGREPTELNEAWRHIFSVPSQK